MTDLYYTDDGVIIRFYPETTAGIKAYNTMAKTQDGCAHIFSFHKDAVFRQLRKAGYTVEKMHKENPVDLSDDDLLQVLRS